MRPRSGGKGGLLHSQFPREEIHVMPRGSHRGITKGEVAKSVNKSATVYPSLNCVFLQEARRGGQGMTFIGYYRGRCRLWIGWFVFEMTQIRLSGTRYVWHLHRG